MYICTVCMYIRTVRICTYVQYVCTYVYLCTYVYVCTYVCTVCNCMCISVLWLCSCVHLCYVCLPCCRYHCYTCGLAENTGVCSVCAKVCHKDHELAFSKHGSFFCDCGARGDGHCKVSLYSEISLQLRPRDTGSLCISEIHCNQLSFHVQ